MLSRYNQYIKESKSENLFRLFVSKRFINVISRMNRNVIRDKFLGSIWNTDNFGSELDIDVDATFIDVTDKNDTISYILASKCIPIINKYRSMGREYDGINLCWLTNRQEQKLSRYINRIFKNEFSLQQLEEFINEYKKCLEQDELQFELVKGQDVIKYYNLNYYVKGNGHLQHSCMRYPQCAEFFKIYANNPEKMNMLILKNKNGKIEGRSNIWFLDEPEDKIFMDRIYASYEWQIKLFIDYAKKNGWMYKSRQVYGGDVIPVVVNGKEVNVTMGVNVMPGDYVKYPYVDTLQFYNPKTGHLTSDVKKLSEDDYITLILPNGDVYIGQDGYKVDYLGRVVNQHFLRWSNIDNVYIHVNDAIYLDYKDDYVTPNHNFIRIDDMIYLEKDVIKDENGKYKPK